MLSCRCNADTEILNFDLETGCNSVKVHVTATSKEISNYTVQFYVKEEMDKVNTIENNQTKYRVGLIQPLRVPNM